MKVNKYSWHKYNTTVLTIVPDAPTKPNLKKRSSKIRARRGRNFIDRLANGAVWCSCRLTNLVGQHPLGLSEYIGNANLFEALIVTVAR